MSKEKTPIKTGGFVRNKNMPKKYDIYLSKVGYDDSIDDLGYVKKCLDELVNAKVLEALGSEFEDIVIFNGMGQYILGTEYYETEVKPKYED